MTNAEIESTLDQIKDLVNRLVKAEVKPDVIRDAVEPYIVDEAANERLIKEYLPKVSTDSDSRLDRAYKQLALSNLIDASRGDRRYIP